ncbi:MAG TPA: hypothetical protein VNL70_00480 [Tepidisphaeraceae bacterium]|nr:hypothetical protein [Tepidisphaeraceae bacterium]
MCFHLARRCVAWFACLICVAESGVLRAQQPPAQTDASTPKAAVKSLYAAVIRGDAQAVRNLLVVENDPDRKLVGAYAELILSGKKLSDAAKQKFPGAVGAFTQGTVSPEDAARVDAAPLTVEADLATLRLEDRQQTLKLQRQPDGWRLVMPDMVGDDPQHRIDRLALLTGLSEAMTLCAEEISGGKFATAQDAENAVRDRLGAVLDKALKANFPTTKATTRP